jgi:hypothetical protein
VIEAVRPSKSANASTTLFFYRVTLALDRHALVSFSLLLLGLLGLLRRLLGFGLLHDLHGLLVERSAPRQVVEPVLRESVTGKVASSGTRAKMNARGSRGTGARRAPRRTESLEEMTDARQNAMMNPIRVFPSIACAAAMRPPSPAIGAVGGCFRETAPVARAKM